MPLISCKEVTRRYHRMLTKTEDRFGKFNCYTCENEECKTITKTIDVDKGTTPLKIKCPKCGALATSSFYNDLVPNADPTHVWFRPNLKQTIKYRKNPDTLEHILKGGLISASINNISKNEEVTTIDINTK